MVKLKSARSISGERAPVGEHQLCPSGGAGKLGEVRLGRSKPYTEKVRKKGREMERGRERERKNREGEKRGRDTTIMSRSTLFCKFFHLCEHQLFLSNDSFTVK